MTLPRTNYSVGIVGRAARSFAWLWVVAWWGRSEYEAGVRIGRIQGSADTLSALLKPAP